MNDVVETTSLLRDDVERTCPPHRVPHTLPIVGGLVTNEPCHVHRSWWHWLHHLPFCKLLRCPHVPDMVRAKRELGAA